MVYFIELYRKVKECKIRLPPKASDQHTPPSTASSSAFSHPHHHTPQPHRHKPKHTTTHRHTKCPNASRRNYLHLRVGGRGGSLSIRRPLPLAGLERRAGITPPVLANLRNLQTPKPHRAPPLPPTPPSKIVQGSS